MAKIDFPLMSALEGVDVDTAIEYNLSQEAQREKVMNHVYKACKEMYPEFDAEENRHILEVLSDSLARCLALKMMFAKKDEVSVYFPHKAFLDNNEIGVKNEYSCKIINKEDI